eukprot:7243482-Pyramimonas_sp.AAC.1
MISRPTIPLTASGIKTLKAPGRSFGSQPPRPSPPRHERWMAPDKDIQPLITTRPLPTGKGTFGVSPP